METHPWAVVQKAQKTSGEMEAGPSGLHRPTDEDALKTVKGFGDGSFDSDALTYEEKWSTITGAIRQLAKITGPKVTPKEGELDQMDEDQSDSEKSAEKTSPEVTEPLNDKSSSSEEDEEPTVKSPSYGRTPPDTPQKRSTRKKFTKTK